jgi:hypothetical protein
MVLVQPAPEPVPFDEVAAVLAEVAMRVPGGATRDGDRERRATGGRINPGGISRGAGMRGWGAIEFVKESASF